MNKLNGYMSPKKAARIAQRDDDIREHLSHCPTPCVCRCAACRRKRDA